MMKPPLAQETFVKPFSTSEKLKIILFWAAGHDPALFSYLAYHAYYWGLICCSLLFCAVCFNLTTDWLTIGPGASSLGSQVSRCTCQGFEWPLWVSHAPAATQPVLHTISKGSQDFYFFLPPPEQCFWFQIIYFLDNNLCEQTCVDQVLILTPRTKLLAEKKILEALWRLWLQVLHSLAWWLSFVSLLGLACNRPEYLAS